MTSDQYVYSIIYKYSIVPLLHNLMCSGTYKNIYPFIKQWANNYLLNVSFSGSFSKGTVIKGTSDMDFFISLHPNTPETMKEIYDKLYTFLAGQKIPARKQNVSIGITYNNFLIDLIPAKKQSGNTNTHTIFKHKKQSWAFTNVHQHIIHIQTSQRIDEIKALKIWKKIHNLDFPSFYLELSVIRALRGKFVGQLAVNVLTVLDYLKNNFINAQIVDPANSNNIISDDLTIQEKKTIAYVANISRSKHLWSQIIW